MSLKSIFILTIILLFTSCSSLSYEEQEYQRHQELCETYISGYEDCYGDIENNIGEYTELVKQDIFESFTNESGYAPDEIQSILHRYRDGEGVSSTELHYVLLYFSEFYDYIYDYGIGLPNDYEIFDEYYSKKCEMDYDFEY